MNKRWAICLCPVWVSDPKNDKNNNNKIVVFFQAKRLAEFVRLTRYESKDTKLASVEDDVTSSREHKTEHKKGVREGDGGGDERGGDGSGGGRREGKSTKEQPNDLICIPCFAPED